MTATLYGDLLAAGVPMDNHESDLYFADTADSRAILARFPDKAKSANRFPNQQDGTTWWDVPFAFLPWWERRTDEHATIERWLDEITERWLDEITEPGDWRD